jgi:hypothetical protein
LLIRVQFALPVTLRFILHPLSELTATGMSSSGYFS